MTMAIYNDAYTDYKFLVLEAGDTPDDAFITARDKHHDNEIHINLPVAVLAQLRDDITRHLQYPPLTEEEQYIVRAIRILWAGDGDMLRMERKQPRELPNYLYPFGNASYTDPDASSDHELLRIFNEERKHHESDLDTIWVMIRG